jgi:hypothetical protein
MTPGAPLRRPPLPVGTFVKILFIDRANGQIEARAKFRDFDGRVRLVSKREPAGRPPSAS